MLVIENLHAGYGPIAVLHGVSLHVDEGEIVTLIGANGAGKSTTLRTISRLIPAASGTILYKNENITRCKAHEIARRGIAHVPEGRGIFGNLTVIENLLLATFANRTRSMTSPVINELFDMFPLLGDRRRQLASTLSGGEQQILAIARAFAADADFFIMDEPSMGLSPILVKNVFSIIADINRRGKTILLVEQNAIMALKYSNRAYVLENGRIAAEGRSEDITANEELKKAYLG
ncbi:MAG: ABC transporter ATP-binding protein [Spirochaetes bacterium RBG_16_49_21]|nr:MAG: ABC transporter ATP-binding protein [Spirochaetes bacterium RBG_16_49_21]